MEDYREENKDYETAYSNIESVLIEKDLYLNDLGCVIHKGHMFLTGQEYYTIDYDINTEEETCCYLAVGLSENYGDYSQYDIINDFLFNSKQTDKIKDLFRFLKTLSLEERQPFKEVYKKIKLIQNARSF